MDVIHISGPARILVFSSGHEVRAPVAMLHMTKLTLREVGDIPVVTQLSCGWSANCHWLAVHQTAKLGKSPIFTTGKAKKLAPRIWRHFCGYPAWLSLRLPDFPKANMN